MEPFLIHGPGSHAHLIESFFDRHFKSWMSARQWPEVAITRHENASRHVVATSRSYEVLSHVSYSINNRLSSFTGGRQFQLDMLANCYDRLCSRELRSARRLLAWSQVSRKSIIMNKRLGGISILEHPMPHINYWMGVNKSFYDDNRFRVKPGYSHFSKAMIKRMHSEYQHADYIQVHSSFAYRTFVDEGIDAARLLVTPLGIDAHEFPHHDAKREPSSRLRLAFVGRLELFKGIHLLLDVFRKLSPMDVELKLIGRILPEVEPLLHDLPNVKVVGPLNKEQISRHFIDTDLLLFPSLNDAFGLVILEAMLHGVPVIASTASAGPDIITHMEDGLVVDANSFSALEQAVRWAIDNRNALPAMGERAKKKVHEKYLMHHYFAGLKDNFHRVGFMSDEK